MKDTPENIVINRAHGTMKTHSATLIHVRDLEPIISDEPPSRGGGNEGPSPLEYILASLCACTNVSAARLADKIRFKYDDLETFAEGHLDTRGRKGQADVPVHYKTVILRVVMTTAEPERKIERLKTLVAKYCPVDSLINAAVPDYQVTWEIVRPEEASS